MKKTALSPYETLSNPEDNLRMAWAAFTQHFDKPRGLWFAYNGLQYLNNQQLDFQTEDELLEKMHRKGVGYHIVAMLFLWNNWFDEALEIEGNFITTAYWHSFSQGIQWYLEMLMIKRQKEHLETLFKDVQFKYAFLTHFEVYYSLLVDSSYTITKMNEFVPLVNKVNNLCRGYGEPVF